MKEKEIKTMKSMKDMKGNCQWAVFFFMGFMSFMVGSTPYQSTPVR